uniref:Uncharacterized protein n=1 Tax=Rhizophora mucronata TaxID=61149 RepID=A0A2P2PIJ9_RHIMU
MKIKSNSDPSLYIGFLLLSSVLSSMSLSSGTLTTRTEEPFSKTKSINFIK